MRLPSTLLPGRLAPIAAVVAAGAIALVLVGGPGFASLPSAVLLVVAYGALTAVTLGGRGLERRHVITLGAGLLLLAVARPPMQSHDLWSYVMYGRTVSHHHVSPYTHAPATFAHDSFVSRVDPLWRHTRSVYGPVFTGAAAVVTFLAGSSVLLSRLGFQLAAAAAVAIGAYVVDRRTGGDPRALALVLLNPLVVLSLVNDAHVDVFVGVAVLASVLLLERRRPRAAGAAIALGVLVKVIAVLPAGALTVWLIGRRSRRSMLAPFVVTLLVVVVAGYAVGGGRSAIQPVLKSSTHVTGASVWTPLDRTEIEQNREHGESPNAARTAAAKRVSRLATLAVVALTGAVALAWRRDDDPSLGAGGAVLAYTIAAAYVYPWYAAGGLFVLATRRRSPLTWLLVAESCVLQLATIPGRQFTTFIRRPVRFPDPVWHQWFRNWGAPALELALVAVLVTIVVRRLRRPMARAALTPR